MSSRSRTLTAFGLAGLFIAGCGSFAGTLDEAGEMIAQGGEKVLREPMRPIRGTQRVLVIALDGVGEQKLSEALEAGDLPELAAYLGPQEDGDVFANGYLARSVPSVFPAETAAGWAAVFTGERPAITGVTGNEWFDRDSVATFAPVPLSVGTLEQTLSIWSGRLFQRRASSPDSVRAGRPAGARVARLRLPWR